MQNSAFMSIHCALQDCQGSPVGLCRGDCVESKTCQVIRNYITGGDKNFKSKSPLTCRRGAAWLNHNSPQRQA